jgi:hypothetical protein
MEKKLAEQITAENPYNEENHEPESYAETIAYMYTAQLMVSNQKMREALEFIQSRLDWEQQPFSIRVVARDKIEAALNQPE